MRAHDLERSKLLFCGAQVSLPAQAMQLCKRVVEMAANRRYYESDETCLVSRW
jgi:hypothetical protein